jgi:predicted short-subunit dehydrogenase-like oxidoreductase (DUF2520 family)
MNLLAPHFREYGVLYPLQSISAGRETDWTKLPLLIEASSPEVLDRMIILAGSLSGSVHEVDSKRRLRLHLAAVFANNFSNHMARIAYRILEEGGEDPGLLLPILEETFEKIRDMGPAAAQTGPARRKDAETMEKHLEVLRGHPEWEKLYTFVSRSIQDE